MKMITRTCFSLVLILLGFCSLIHCYDVRLSMTLGQGQGLVEVRRSNDTGWGQICDRGFGQHEARVVCRQLGYRYARAESQTNKRVSTYFVIDYLRCRGNETSIDQCPKEEPAYVSCHVNGVNVFAGVCCSESELFGEVVGDVFISHCGVSWMEGEGKCETLGGHLTTPEQVFKRQDALNGMVAHTGLKLKPALWMGTFFTPWIWSNGCVRLQDTTAILRQIILATNSPKMCVQHCGLLSNTFLLAGTQCACLKPDAVVSEVRPYLCSALCPGDGNKWYCGSGDGQYWNIFTTATDEIFFRYSEPHPDALTQCAVLTRSTMGPSRLTTNICEEDKGHICQQFDKGDMDLLFMQSAGDMGSVEAARTLCGKKSGDLKLVGNSVLDKKRFYGNYEGLWVDLTRMRTDIDPELNVTSMSALNPKWCLSMTGNGSSTLVACDTRQLFSCVVDSANSPDGGSGGSTSTGSAEDSSQPEMIHLVIIICSALLVALIIIGIVICWVHRSKRKSRRLCCFGNAASASRPDTSTGYSVTYHAANTSNTDTVDHVYDEINERKMDNAYQEVGRASGNNEYQPLTTADISPTDVGYLKAPVTMQRSYSHPHDMMLVGRDNSGSSREKNYVYPYDSLLQAKREGDECSNDVKNVPRSNVNGVAVKCKDNIHEGNTTVVDLLWPVESVTNITYNGKGISDHIPEVHIDNHFQKSNDNEVEIRINRKSDSVLQQGLKRDSREKPMRNSAS